MSTFALLEVTPMRRTPTLAADPTCKEASRAHGSLAEEEK